MTNRPDDIDPVVAALLRRREPVPLGLTARLAVGVARRAREANRLTPMERVCVIAFWGLIGAMGGPPGIGVALLAGFIYGRVTVVVEA